MYSIRNKLITRSVSATLGVALLAGLAVKPVRSEAAVAALVVGQYAAVAEVVQGLFKVGAVSFVASTVASYTTLPDPANLFDSIATASIWAVLAGITLDDSGNQKIVLNSISNELAAKAQISQSEQESFEHELDVIQPLFDDIAAQVAHAPKAERAALSRGLWDQYRSAIAPDAFTALQKAVTYLASQHN